MLEKNPEAKNGNKNPAAIGGSCRYFIVPAGCSDSSNVILLMLLFHVWRQAVQKNNYY